MHFLCKVSLCLAFWTVSSLSHASTAATTQEDETMFEISTYTTHQIEPLLPLLQEWGERAFIQYPYLWVPAQDEIFTAFALLAEEENALVAIVKDHGKIVGMAAGVPFDAQKLQALFDEDAPVSEPSLSQKLHEQGFDPSQIFYMSTFLTAPEYHNDERLVELIYGRYVEFIQEIGKQQICYFDDLGTPEHPLRPQNLTPIEPWGCVIKGFRSMNVKKDFTWPTLQMDGSIKDEIHHLEFFVKDI